ncbi:MAG: hypothetical protein K9J76_05345 [Polaromonas sp.]|nr:hypothetical protein [Polaromonas sp.]
MKHDETQAYAQDIRTQHGAGKMYTMNTPTITLNLLSALLLCVGAAQAAEPQRLTTERPLDASVPHDAKALQEWRKKQALERNNIKPYGSGYEARGLEGRNNNDAEAILLRSSRTDDKNSVADSQSVGGTSGGGTGGSSSGGTGGNSSGGSGGRGGGQGGRGR